MIQPNPNQFQRKIGYFLGLNYGYFRSKIALQIKSPTEFINYIQNDSLFHIKSKEKNGYDSFNEGISTTYSDLYKSFDKVLIPDKLTEILNEFKIKIENYKLYFLQDFYDLDTNTNTNPDRKPYLNDNFELIQNIRTQIPYFMGMLSGFFIFNGETNYLTELDLPDTLKKLAKLQDSSDFHNIFYIGFIEILLKLHSHYFLYHSDKYRERIAKIEQNLIEKAKIYRMTYKFFSLNEIFQ